MSDTGAVPEFDGPVTVMFTDIEGSTALRTTLGDAEADALFGRHDELLRSEIEAHRGHDFQAALGDGFLAVFVSTRRAIACAVTIQQALDRFNAERRGAQLRVRIGLNTGEIAWQNGQPSGEAIHAASRVCGAADGGEVFVSDVTRQLAGTVPDVTFTDQGEHTLKGFPHPWKLWSLAWRPAAATAQHDVFVGREHELAELRKHLSAALDGNGGLVLVGGEPGVGKTTLTKELIKEAEARGALALFGRCYESEGAVPYSPFVEMVEQGLTLVPPEWVREDLGEDAAEVARMVPELRRRFTDIGDPLDLPPEQQRRYFFNAMTSFITRAAARAPLLIVLDDVHWADEPTLLLIEHVASALQNLPILGVGTYRDVELDVSRPLAATLERLLRARTAARIPVYRFDRAGVAHMLEALADRPAPESLVDAIYSETEGNPFFVEEVFRHFVEEGKVFDDTGDFLPDIVIDELDVPESVRLVVGRRLERLGPDAHKALAAGAIVGRAFSFRLLEAIANLDAGAVLDVVDEAERARVIVPEEREGDVHYTFAHELIRQTLLSSLTIPRRQRLHLAVADAMERIDPRAREIRPSEIATHLLEAGVAADADRTIDALTRAADRAFDAAAFEDAARFVESALELLDAGEDLRHAQLYERLAHTQRAGRHFDEALENYRSVMKTYISLGEAEAAGRLCFDAGYLLTYLARFQEAFAINQEGIAALGDLVVPERAHLLAGSGAIMSLAGYPQAAEPSFTEAERIAGDFGPAVQGRVAWLRCVQHINSGDFVSSAAAGRRAVDLLRSCGDLWTLADALGWLSLPLVSLGEMDAGVAAAKEAIEIAKSTGHTTAALLAERAPAERDFAITGDLVRLAEFAHRDMEAFSGSPFLTQSYVWLGIATDLQGNVDEALRYHERACELEPPSAISPQAWAYRTLNRALAGASEECSAQLAERTADLVAENAASLIGRWVARLAAGQAAAIVGDVEIARALYTSICADLADHPFVMIFDGASPARVAGMLAATIGSWDEAAQHFEAASSRDLWATEAPQVAHWHGKMLVDRGRNQDQERARELLGSALDDYERLGMPVHAAMARELLTVHA